MRILHLPLLLVRPRCRELFGGFGDLGGLGCRCVGFFGSVEMVETFLWFLRIFGWFCGIMRLIDI